MQKNTIERKIDWFIQLVLIAVGDFGHGSVSNTVERRLRKKSSHLQLHSVFKVERKIPNYELDKFVEF